MTSAGRPGRPSAEGAAAGLPRRLAALVYDLMLLAGLLFVFTLAVFVLRGGRGVAPGTLWFQSSLGAVAMLFFTWFWTHGGQTLGMRAWRLRVVDAAGGPLGWGKALGRFFAALLSALPAGLGFWWAAIDPDKLCWHDRLSGTKVVRTAAGAR
ncbi:MAG TPA: RDD family protein [Gammaproteobacteria bacterium]